MSFLTACTSIGTLALAAAGPETTILGYDCNFEVRQVPGGDYDIPDLVSGERVSFAVEPFSIMPAPVLVDQGAVFFRQRDSVQKRRSSGGLASAEPNPMLAAVGGRDMSLGEAPTETHCWDPHYRLRIPGWVRQHSAEPMLSVGITEATAFAHFAARQTGRRATVPTYAQWAAALQAGAIEATDAPDREWVDTLFPFPEQIFGRPDCVVVSGAWRVHSDRSGFRLRPEERFKVMLPAANLTTGFRLAFREPIGRGPRQLPTS